MTRSHWGIIVLVVLILLTLFFIVGETSTSSPSPLAVVTNTITDLSPRSQTASTLDSDSSLVAHYTFDDANNLGADSSGKGNNGTLQGANGLPTATAGKVGSGAIKFDGVKGGVDMGDMASAENIPQISVSAWVRHLSTGVNSYLVTKQRSGFTSWVLGKTNNGTKYYFTVVNTSGTSATASSDASTYSDLLWHHVVGVYDGTNVYVYVDGISTDSTPASLVGNVRDRVEHVCVGSSSEGSSCVNATINGVIDDVRIYSRALSASEVSQLYSEGNGSSVPSGNTTPGDTTPTPANGVCSTTLNTCTTGTFTDVGDTTTNNLWSCTGSNGGTTASCSLPITTTPGDTNPAPVNGACGPAATTYTSTQTFPQGSYCTSGTPTPSTPTNPGAGSSSTWSCSGANGGNSASCTATRQSPPVTETPQDTTYSSPPSGAQVIGREALQEFPTSALWSSVVNFRPGNGEVVSLNPPIFTWSYTPHPKDSSTDISPKEFIFQLSNSSQYSQLLANVRTSSNMYNFLAPLESGKKYYWRIGYINPKDTNNKVSWTTKADSWAQTPYVWSATRSFTISPTATSWDRHMLADPSYLSQKSIHPHILFNQGNSSSLYSFLQDKEYKYNVVYRPYNRPKNATSDIIEYETGRGWVLAKKKASQDIRETWWTSENPTINPSNIWMTTWADSIANAAFVWQMTNHQTDSTHPDYLLHRSIEDAKPQDALIRLVRWYSSKGYDRADDVATAAGPIIRDIGFGYDWLYDLMTESQRLEVRALIESRAKYILDNIWWFSANNFGTSGDPTNVYSGGLKVETSSFAKVGNNHPDTTFAFSLVPVLAVYGESGKEGDLYAQSGAARDLLPLMINYMLARVSYFGEPDQGRGYSPIELFTSVPLLFGHIAAQSTFPESRFNLNPFWQSLTDRYSRYIPVGFIHGNEQWGDTGQGRIDGWATPNFGFSLAYFTGSGIALKHWAEEDKIISHERVPFQWYLLPVAWLFQMPIEQPNISSSKIFPTEGWAFGCSFPSNTKDCFANGVGFIMQARPGGWISSSHSDLSDLTYELWAYNTTITDQGAGYSNYGKVPFSMNAVLVNGVGTMQSPVGKQSEPFYSRIFAFKQNPDYTYVGTEGAAAYPRTNFNPVGLGVLSEYARLSAGAPLSFLKKANRHMLFVRNKFFVIYDDLLTNQNGGSTFTSLYHILENGVQFENTEKTSFKYMSNIHKYVKPSETTLVVPVSVSYISQSGSLDVVHFNGGNVRKNPITGSDYANLGAGYTRSDALWISNKTPSTSFHFMTVIYPKNPADSSKPDPKIERIDDYTARVTSPDGSVDVITFNNNPQATIAVDLSQLTPLPVVDDVTGTTVTSVPYVPPPSNPGNDTTPPSSSCTTYPTGDFNHDCAVNSLDFSALSAYWNQSSSSVYDLTGDNLVNTLDYVVLVKNWSK